MSNKGTSLADVLTRASRDNRFLDTLIEQPRKALSEYGSLTTEEREALCNLFDKIKGQELATLKIREIFESCRMAFTDMRIMNWATFLLGAILLAVAIWLAVSGQREVYVLLFGGMGIVSIITYLLVKPMKRVSDALSDFLQAHITFESFNHQIGVWYEFGLTKDEKGETVRRTLSLEEAKEASKALQEIRESTVRLLQEMLGEKPAKADKQ